MTRADKPTESSTLETKSSAIKRARVVVGIDCSPESHQVLRKAADIAGLLGADLEAVFVYLSMTDRAGVWPMLVPEDQMKSYGQSLLRVTVRDAFEDDGPPGLSLWAVGGDPASMLLARSRDAAMLVVGSSDHTVLTSLLLGSVAAKCVEHAPVPVLIVHPNRGVEVAFAAEPAFDTRPDIAQQSAGRIVVGVDGSSASKQALRWAAHLAKIMCVGIDAVITWELPVYLGAFGPGYVTPHWAPHTEYAGYLNTYIDDVFGDHRPADLRLFAEEGNAAGRLLVRAERAALLVVGNRGCGGFTSLLLGSVSAKCANHASCPVLVVHAAAGAGGDRSSRTQDAGTTMPCEPSPISPAIQ